MLGGVNYFTYDGGLQDLLNEAERLNDSHMNTTVNRQSMRSLLRMDILSTITSTLTVSHQIIKELQCIAAADALQDKDAIVQISSNNKFIGVASFVNNQITGEYSFIIKVKHNGSFMYQSVSNDSPTIEPLCYPLLFPCGELGFDPYNKRIRLQQYVCCRLLMPELQLGFYQNGSLRFPFNRFTLMARLMQYWLCETVCRAINFKLEYIRKNQDTLFGVQYDNDDNEDDLENSDDDDDDELHDRHHLSSKNKTFLADSFTGSPRHLKKLSMNALTIVSELGPPDAFITITFNPLWPEVIQALASNQTIFDRPDLQARIFHARLEAFIINLRNGKYYVNSQGHNIKLKYLLRVIEYQNRGLPHCHVVIKLNDDHDPIRFMNRYCRSTISDLNDSDAYQQQVKVLIQQHMIHRCSAYCLNNGHCRKGFGINKVIESSQVDHKGFPIHKRLTQDDFNVVPTHDKMIIDWNGHINHEPAAQSFTVLYLFKYLFKGNQKMEIEINDDDHTDEIRNFQRGKMLCASDAAWRMFGFQNYPKSTPSTVLIKVKTPLQMDRLLDNKQICDLMVYFSRLRATNEIQAQLRDELLNMKYAEFFQHWIYKTTLPRNNIQQNYEISVPFNNTNKTLFIVRRKNNGNDVVVRMGTLYVTMGEPWYLRLLLLRKATTSFKQLLTVNDMQFARFQDAAVKEGYVNDHTAAKICFNEMRNLKTPNELRVLFVTMTIAGYPTLLLIEDRECVRAMMADILHDNDHNWDLSYRQLQLNLQQRFKAANVSMKDFGIPEPQKRISETEYMKLRYDVQRQKQIYEQCIMTNPFTDEMQVCYQFYIVGQKYNEYVCSTFSIQLHKQSIMAALNSMYFKVRVVLENQPLSKP